VGKNIGGTAVGKETTDVGKKKVGRLVG